MNEITPKVGQLWRLDDSGEIVTITAVQLPLEPGGKIECTYAGPRREKSVTASQLNRYATLVEGGE